MRGSDQEVYAMIIRSLDEPDNPDNQKALQEWLVQKASNRTLLAELKSLWEGAAEASIFERAQTDAATARFMHILHERYPSATATSAPPTRNWWKYAAAAAITGLAALTYWWAQPAPEKLTTFRTAAQTDSVTLSDGTRIVLRSHSAIRYPETFRGKTRTVFLDEGTAFFAVQQDAAHPFTAAAGNLNVDVLGTAFNLSITGPSIKLYVAEGEVAFGRNGDNSPLRLQAGKGASFHKNTGTLAPDREADPNALAWKTGELRFVDMPMEEVCKVLSDCYGMTVILENDSRKAQKLNARFSQRSIEEVLQTLNALYDYRYEKRGDTVFIH